MVRYLLLLLLVNICSAVDLQPQNIQELLGQAKPRFTAEQVVAHIRVMNPGARVLIYVIDDPEMFNWYLGLPADEAGYILGLFRPNGSNGTAPDIAILGKWSIECSVALHEYTHLLEDQIPWAREEIRAVFQKLISDDFRIGATDLTGPAEPNAEVIQDDLELLPPGVH